MEKEKNLEVNFAGERDGSGKSVVNEGPQTK